MGMKLEFLPGNPSVFMSTHQDGRARLFDLRSNGYKTLIDHSDHGRAPAPPPQAALVTKSTSNCIISNNSTFPVLKLAQPMCPCPLVRSRSLSDIAFDPTRPMHFALGSDEPVVRLFDLRYAGPSAPDRRKKAHVACLQPRGALCVLVGERSSCLD